jgi:hypothetical protein
LSSHVDTRTRPRHWWPYYGTAGLFWVAPAGLLLIGYLVLPEHITSGDCEGDLFGCSLSPKGGTVVLAVFVYPFFVVAGWLAIGVIAVGRAWRRRSG